MDERDYGLASYYEPMPPTENLTGVEFMNSRVWWVSWQTYDGWERRCFGSSVEHATIFHSMYSALLIERGQLDVEILKYAQPNTYERPYKALWWVYDSELESRFFGHDYLNAIRYRAHLIHSGSREAELTYDLPRERHELLVNTFVQSSAEEELGRVLDSRI